MEEKIKKMEERLFFLESILEEKMKEKKRKEEEKETKRLAREKALAAWNCSALGHWPEAEYVQYPDAPAAWPGSTGHYVCPACGARR